MVRLAGRLRCRKRVRPLCFRRPQRNPQHQTNLTLLKEFGHGRP